MLQLKTFLAFILLLSLQIVSAVNYNASGSLTPSSIEKSICEVIKRGTNDNIYYKHIVESLIVFIKVKENLKLETDFTTAQIFHLATIFQNVIKLENLLLTRLIKLTSNSNAELARNEFKHIKRQFACLEDFGACINLQVVAKRLASKDLLMAADAIEYLLPYASIYENELKMCASSQVVVSSNHCASQRAKRSRIQ